MGEKSYKFGGNPRDLGRNPTVWGSNPTVLGGNPTDLGGNPTGLMGNPGLGGKSHRFGMKSPCFWGELIGIWAVGLQSHILGSVTRIWGEIPQFEGQPHSLVSKKPIWGPFLTIFDHFGATFDHF